MNSFINFVKTITHLYSFPPFLHYTLIIVPKKKRKEKKNKTYDQGRIPVQRRRTKWLAWESFVHALACKATTANSHNSRDLYSRLLLRWKIAWAVGFHGNCVPQIYCAFHFASNMHERDPWWSPFFLVRLWGYKIYTIAWAIRVCVHFFKENGKYSVYTWEVYIYVI